MWGRKQQRIAHLERLSASRGERLTETTKYVEILTQQRHRVMGRHDDLLQIIATHITTGTNPDQLHRAMVRAGFSAELNYALLDHPHVDERRLAAIKAASKENHS